MAKKVTEELMGVSGSVPPSLHAAMEDARWGYKRNMSQMVRAALEFYAESEGFWTRPEPEPVTIDADDPKLTDNQRAALAADAERAKAAQDELDAAAQAELDAKAAADAKTAEDAAKAQAEADGDTSSDTSDTTPEPVEADKPKTTSRARK